MAPELVVAGDGVRLAAYRFGGYGPPLLLCHATGLHAHVWLPMLPVLRRHFTLYAFDLRGHGESEAPRDLEAYDWRTLGDDVLAVADAFGLVRFAAVGHSAGGALVIQAELTRPGTVSGAVLVEPILYPPEVTGDSPGIALAERRRAVFDSTDDMIERWSSRGPFAALHPEALRCYVEFGVRDLPDGRVALKCDPRTEAMTYRGDVRSGIWERLPGYLTPTLILTGRRDGFRRSEWAEGQATAMVNARAERDPTLGHFMPLERPEAIARRVVRFLVEGR